MTSHQLVPSLQSGLRRHEASNVVPDGAVVERAWRDAIARRVAAEAMSVVEVKARAYAATGALPHKLAHSIRGGIDCSELPWAAVLATIVSREQLDRQAG